MKTINKILTLILIWLISSASTCKKETENCHYTIKFYNTTSNNIYIHSGEYPDTIYINGFSSPVLNPQSYKIESGQTNTSALWGKSCYESNMTDSRVYPFGKTMIYVFDAAVLESTPWDTVKARNMYLKRYDLTLKDLQDRDWTITYP